MSLRPLSAVRTLDPRQERIQREHELNEALKAARHLQARLEMVGGYGLDVRWTLSLRARLASDFDVPERRERSVIVIDDTQFIIDEDDGVTLAPVFKEKDGS